MAGYPLAQVRRADGGVLTLYRGTEHPFIHALNSVDGWALCIDLPATKADDAAAAADWGLARDARRADVYAINATLGLVVEVDPTDFAISRSTAVTPLAGERDRPGQVRPPGERADRAARRGRPRRPDRLRGGCRRDPGDRRGEPEGPRHVRSRQGDRGPGRDPRRRHPLRPASGTAAGSSSSMPRRGKDRWRPSRATATTGSSRSSRGDAATGRAGRRSRARSATRRRRALADDQLGRQLDPGLGRLIAAGHRQDEPGGGDRHLGKRLADGGQGGPTQPATGRSSNPTTLRSSGIWSLASRAAW